MGTSTARADALIPAGHPFRVDELSAFRDRAPGMPYAHPTVEHFTPLFVTLGAATDPGGPVTTAIEGFSIGFSKRSFQTA